jgi:hypothetical protein
MFLTHFRGLKGHDPSLKPRFKHSKFDFTRASLDRLSTRVQSLRKHLASHGDCIHRLAMEEPNWRY